MSCIGTLIRIPIGTILGYIVMMGGIFAGLSAVMVFAGVDFCYDGDSWVASDRFCAVSLGVTAVAAFLGGFTAMRIGGTMAVVLVCVLAAGLGSLSALGMLGEADEIRLKDRPEQRPDDLGALQAAQWSENPNEWEWGNVAASLAGLAVGAAVGKCAPREPKRAKSKSRE